MGDASGETEGSKVKREMKKALIYNPYLDTLGGGERYCLTLAECLLADGWDVHLPWPDQHIKEKLVNRLGLEINELEVVDPNALSGNAISKLKVFRNYDFIFWLSDGSVPFLFGKKNFLHLQVPFADVRGKSLFNGLKLKFIDQIICNSGFTKRFIDKEFGVKSVVAHPPVDVEKFKPGKKEKIILAVGRFEETMQAKKQDILIKVFKKMVDGGLKGWRLLLVGGSLQKPEKNLFLKRLRGLAEGYPISFLANASFEKLKECYSKARIFWHAAGYGIDEKKEPWRVEHFGITTVEAMAAGCVPVVMDKGGLCEIVRRGAGERWETVEELQEKTFEFINNEKKLNDYSLKAQKESLKFSKINFCKQLMGLIKK